MTPIHGMMNLRRMRVEDVAVRGRYRFVPDTITKEDWSVFPRKRDDPAAGLYGTLDTPIGMAHLKDSRSNTASMAQR